MKMTTRNYAEFYALLNKLPGATNGLKEDLVMQFTKGRTSSLREMKTAEYRSMCASLRKSAVGMDEKAFVDEIKRRRSAALKRMQQIGIDTTKWSNVDNFCLNPRIAGKRFAKLTVEELAVLIPKLENILRKDEKKKINTPGQLLNVGNMQWS